MATINNDRFTSTPAVPCAQPAVVPDGKANGSMRPKGDVRLRERVWVRGDALEATSGWSAVHSARVSGRADEARAQKKPSI
jgi:hypothetical protein